MAALGISMLTSRAEDLVCHQFVRDFSQLFSAFLANELSRAVECSFMEEIAVTIEDCRMASSLWRNCSHCCSFERATSSCQARCFASQSARTPSANEVNEDMKFCRTSIDAWSISTLAF